MSRPIRVIAEPPGPGVLAALAAAVDGTGPAVCPLAPDLPPAVRDATLEVLGTGETEAAVLIATSGSTGTPKIVELTAAALRHSATATLRRLDAADDRWLCCLPTSHIAGIQVLVRSIVAGTEPVIQADFDPAAVAASGADHIAVVPTQLHRLVEAGVDLGRFATILLGGAAPPAGLLAAARARGARVVTTYGMSETCGGCVYDGVPLDGVETSTDGDGRIRIAGPVLFAGYRGRPDLTAEVSDGRWFRTGDLGEIADGLLRVRGRADDVINTGGEKVVPGEVERAVGTHPAVKDVVVVGRPDPEWGEVVTAVVVAAAPLTLADLRAHVAGLLPRHAAPRALEVVASLPLLASGKPDRRALRARRT